MAARAGVQLGVEEKALAKRTPSAASLSRLGVLIAALPAQLRASARIWSAIMKRMLGGVCGSGAARDCTTEIVSSRAAFSMMMIDRVIDRCCCSAATHCSRACVKLHMWVCRSNLTKVQQYRNTCFFSLCESRFFPLVSVP